MDAGDDPMADGRREQTETLFPLKREQIERNEDGAKFWGDICGKCFCAEIFLKMLGKSLV